MHNSYCLSFRSVCDPFSLLSALRLGAYLVHTFLKAHIELHQLVFKQSFGELGLPGFSLALLSYTSILTFF